MVSDFSWPAIWQPVLVGLLLSLPVEHLLRPGVSWPWQRPLATLALHCGIWLLVFSCELVQFRRPWFAAFVVLTILLVLVLVSNAKFHALREPFIFQDVEYFLDTLRHPRLYLPFFGLGKALLATVAFLLALAAGLSFEPPLTDKMTTGDFLTGLAVLTAAGVFLLMLGVKRPLPLSLVPDQDLHRLGLLASLWRYGTEESRCPPLAAPFAYPSEEISRLAPLPHLVAVQSESFFDVRRWIVGCRPEVLAHFDALQQEAVFQGRLAVPAWGANTVRTEFAFLTGLAAERLGVHRFNPYRRLARPGIATLATLLQGLGYRTICVHPYPATFYGRDTLFPRMGFDAFIDIRAFEGAQKSGPYIGDAAVAAKVCTLLSADDAQPTFLFVITMENHGPLHWEQVAPGDVERLYTTPPPKGCEDLTIYLRHLAEADRMAGTLAACLADLAHPAWLCWYGDHVPIMPKVYDALGFPDGRTDYLLWTNKGGATQSGHRRDLRAEELGGLLLDRMGLRLG